MWSSASAPLCFPFTQTKELHQQLTSVWLYLFKKSFYLHTYDQLKSAHNCWKKQTDSLAYPVDATEEPGLSFSLGIPPDHTGHKNQSRKPSLPYFLNNPDPQCHSAISQNSANISWTAYLQLSIYWDPYSLYTHNLKAEAGNESVTHFQSPPCTEGVRTSSSPLPFSSLTWKISLIRKRVYCSQQLPDEPDSLNPGHISYIGSA